MDQGQLRVIIYINFAELEYILFHAMFHDHRTISSVGEDFEGFYHKWAWWPSNIYINFPSHILSRLHTKFGFDWPSSLMRRRSK